jgi:hypothetical protein
MYINIQAVLIILKENVFWALCQYDKMVRVFVSDFPTNKRW